MFGKITVQAFEAEDFLNIFGGFEAHFLIKIFLIKKKQKKRSFTF